MNLGLKDRIKKWRKSRAEKKKAQVQKKKEIKLAYEEAKHKGRLERAKIEGREAGMKKPKSFIEKLEGFGKALSTSSGKPKKPLDIDKLFFGKSGGSKSRSFNVDANALLFGDLGSSSKRKSSGSNANAVFLGSFPKKRTSKRRKKK